MPIYTSWNPDDKDASITLSNNNCTATMAANTWASVRSILPVSSGKHYIAITYDSGSYVMIGVADSDAALDATGFWADTSGYGYHSQTGNKFNSGSNTTYGDSYGTMSTIGLALDMDNGKLWWAKDGVWQASGDPATGSNPAYTGLSGELYIIIGLYNASATANFGGSSFPYTVPTGFNAGISSSTYQINGVVKTGGSVFPGAKVLLIDRVTQELVAVTTAAETTAEYSFTGLTNGDAGRYATHTIDITDTYNDVADSAITPEEE